MADFFITLLNMSLVSGWLILAVVILRLLLKKAPKAFVCLLWGLVGLRLICPFTVESALSLIPNAEPVSQQITESQYVPDSDFGVYAQDIENLLTTELAPAAGASKTPLQAISLVAAFIWAVGFALMLIISLVSFLRLKKRVGASIFLGNKTYICDDIASPFVLGIFKPRIYVPSALTEYELGFVIAHENAHIKRRDYLIKPLGYIILSLHWFNPLVWVAYILLCRDIESACDERVIKDMTEQGKKDYSEILLRLSMPSKGIRACPVAFGEVGVKSRIKSVINYKKPAFWILIATVVTAALLSVCFMTNPISAEEEKDLDAKVSEAILAMNQNKDTHKYFATENHVILDLVENEQESTVRAWAYYGEYELEDGNVVKVREIYEPVAVQINWDQEEPYKCIITNSVYEDYEGGELFTDELYNSVTYTPGYYNQQKEACKAAACQYFGVADTSNEYLPTFNATVLEVYDNDILVIPFEGETVCGEKLGKVKVSTRKLTTDEYVPRVGDKVQIRYVAKISDETLPRLNDVYTITNLNKTGYQTTMVLTDSVNSCTYLLNSSTEPYYMYESEGVQLWLSTTYVGNSRQGLKFEIRYPDTDFTIKGDYTISDGRLYLIDYTLDDEGVWTNYCFIFDIVDEVYVFNADASSKLEPEHRPYPDMEYPFEEHTVLYSGLMYSDIPS